MGKHTFVHIPSVSRFVGFIRCRCVVRIWVHALRIVRSAGAVEHLLLRIDLLDLSVLGDVVGIICVIKMGK